MSPSALRRLPSAPVTNKAIARHLALAAALVELSGGNASRSRAFAGAARAVERLDGSAEALGPGHPWLVPPGQSRPLADALADALAELIANPDLRQALGQRARERVIAERNWDAVTRRLRDSLDQLL